VRPQAHAIKNTARPRALILAATAARGRKAAPRSGRPGLAGVEPAHLLGGEPDRERLEAVVELDEAARADQRQDRERLRQRVGERDVDRALAEALGELDCAVAAGEVGVGKPDPDQFGVVAPVPAGGVGEEAAALARPGEVGELALGRRIVLLG
jgi:hypothetical protein